MGGAPLSRSSVIENIGGREQGLYLKLQDHLQVRSKILENMKRKKTKNCQVGVLFGIQF